jgi:hypothetical protein
MKRLKWRMKKLNLIWDYNFYKMPGFTESNITLDFPNNNFFRLSTCAGYTALSGNYFKEMDACWYDNVNNVYWLFELKDYSPATLDVSSIDKRTWDIVKKSVDSLCMFLSSKHFYPFNIDACIPSVPDVNTQLKFITIVHCKAAQKPDVQLINNAFRNRFKPYATLFGINDYAVVEHSSAIRNIPNNMVQ